MRPIRFEPEATEELRAAVEWYEKRRAGLGEDFFAEVASALEVVREYPATGNRPPGVPERLDTRRVSLGRFPYHVVFMEVADQIRVIAVAHHRQRPGYWRKRLTSLS